jgi:hypothetical protein
MVRLWTEAMAMAKVSLTLVYLVNKEEQTNVNSVASVRPSRPYLLDARLGDIKTVNS